MAEAAIQTGRSFITIEKDAAFHAGILERLSKTKSKEAEGSEGSEEIEFNIDDDEEADIEAAFERHRK